MSVLGIIDAMRTDIPPCFRLVWQSLEDHARCDRCWRGTEQSLAEELHIGAGTVARAVKALEGKGDEAVTPPVISIERSKRRPTLFRLLRSYPSKGKNGTGLTAENDGSTQAADIELTTEIERPTAAITHQNSGPTDQLTDDIDGSTPPLTHQNRGLTSPVTHQNRGSTGLFTLENDESTAESTHQNSGTLSTLREESLSNSSTSVPKEGTLVARASRAPKRKSQIRDDWALGAKGIAFAEARGVDPQAEVERFVAYHLAKGSLMADWDAAWRTWCMNSNRFSIPRSATSRNGDKSALDTIREEWGLTSFLKPDFDDEPIPPQTEAIR